MCTYVTQTLSVEGSGKGPPGWIRVSRGSVYFDHPVHAPEEHTLNVDLLDPSAGPSARVGLELSPESARALAEAILSVLDTQVSGQVTGSVTG